MEWHLHPYLPHALKFASKPKSLFTILEIRELPVGTKVRLVAKPNLAPDSRASQLQVGDELVCALSPHDTYNALADNKRATIWHLTDAAWRFSLV